MACRTSRQTPSSLQHLQSCSHILAQYSFSVVATWPVVFAQQDLICLLCGKDHVAAYCLQDRTKGFMDCWLQSSFCLGQITSFSCPLWNAIRWLAQFAIPCGMQPGSWLTRCVTLVPLCQQAAGATIPSITWLVWKVSSPAPANLNVAQIQPQLCVLCVWLLLEGLFQSAVRSFLLTSQLFDPGNWSCVHYSL